MRYHQILTDVPGQGFLCVAKVPAGIPGAYAIAEDIARIMSHRGRSHIVTDGRAAVGFTNGRRDAA
jgi:hypothetical protein